MAFLQERKTTEYIRIPKNNSNNKLFEKEEQTVHANIFDPSKSSPPNEWNQRLKKRIAQYNLTNSEPKRYYWPDESNNSNNI